MYINVSQSFNLQAGSHQNTKCHAIRATESTRDRNMFQIQ